MEQPVAKIEVDEKILAKTASSGGAIPRISSHDVLFLSELGEWRVGEYMEFLFSSFAEDSQFTEWMKAEYPEAFI